MKALRDLVIVTDRVIEPVGLPVFELAKLVGILLRDLVIVTDRVILPDLDKVSELVLHRVIVVVGVFDSVEYAEVGIGVLLPVTNPVREFVIEVLIDELILIVKGNVVGIEVYVITEVGVIEYFPEFVKFAVIDAITDGIVEEYGVIVILTLLVSDLSDDGL